MSTKYKFHEQDQLCFVSFAVQEIIMEWKEGMIDIIMVEDITV